MSPPGLSEAFSAHRQALWALGYRMLGTASDAEDAVQDAFVRAMERPPADLERPWKPWLVRVLMNACRDRLRKRKHVGYPGPWLPAPVSTESVEPLRVDSLFGSSRPDARIELLESVSMAFLLAVEALTPQQRAVLVLRDVCDCSGAETAELLGLSVGNVKVTLHRARKALERDRVTAASSLADASAVMGLIARFAAALQSGELERVRAVMADDVVLLSDGGGVVRAANKPVLGGDHVAAVYFGLAKARSGDTTAEVRMFNGSPAVVTTIKDPPRRWGHHSILFLVPNDDGRIGRVFSVVAPDKIADALGAARR
ncbi:MAG: sigma-70 family RNA polymerase sigma factor [Deltaproteobacteria bacterium]|nr:sigma-70 family RNA polymerase sigma factor [Deltaproteobacteria bacterium]